MRPRSVVQRWVAALNRGDVEAAVSCFHDEYRDEAPARRGEVVHGAKQVRDNFSRLLADIPDLHAELLAVVEEGDAVWMEWRMHGTRKDGTRMEFTGVNIFGVENDQFRWGRIYTELVREGGGVASQIDRMTRG